ncbi:MAG: twin-arginine translocation signal domain-containing protein, partial [Bryobacterales bacterium]|nr:twin-arginine translocation signal domain-containing protein [Bryobacterales bacterium]
MKTINSIQRRDFLKTVGLASAGFTLVPRHVLGGPGYVAPSDKLRVAGIGCGGKGDSDLRLFSESGKAEIVAVCDVDDRQAVKTRERFPKAPYYKDFRKMLDKEAKNIDAV